MGVKKRARVNLEHIVEGLRPLAFPIGELVPDPANTRKHGDRNIGVIANGLKEFRQDQPIVAERGTNLVIKGNGRLAAAKQLGWTHMAVVFVESRDQYEQQARSIHDNRSSELATWDMGQLARTVVTLRDGGRDVEGIGFNAEDLKNLTDLLAPEQPDGPGDIDVEPGTAFPPPIRMTWEQRGVFEHVVRQMKAEYGDGVSEGRIVELLCADWLSGRNGLPDPPPEALAEPGDGEGEKD